MIVAHTADWHLHSSRSRIDPESGLNARLMDFSRCARFTIEDSIERGAQLIVHAGDVFNGCRPTPTEVRLAKQAFAPAQNAGVPIVIIKGNHDDVRSPSEMHALDLLRDMSGIRVVDRPEIINVWRHEHLHLQLHRGNLADSAVVLQLACLPYPNRQLLLRDEETRKVDPGDLNVLVREKMMDCATGLAAQRIDGVPCLLLGHFSVDLAEVGTQNRLMMLGGEFTLNLHELEALGFDAILLGHIHKQQIFHQVETPVLYCGSPEAVSFGEEGEVKSYRLWDIGEETIDAQQVHTPYRKFLSLRPEDFDEEGQLRDPGRVADAIVRVKLPAADTSDLGAVRQMIESAGAFEVRVEKERAETVRRREVEVSQEMGLSAAIEAWLEQKPDLHPLTDQIITEAMRIERDLTEAEGGAV